MSKTLTTAQENLLRALQRGVRLTLHTIFFITRDDTQEAATEEANALVELGLLEYLPSERMAKDRWRLTEAGRSWPALPEKESTK